MKCLNKRITCAIGNNGKLLGWLFNIQNYVILRVALQVCVGFIMILKACDHCKVWKHSNLFPFQLALVFPRQKLTTVTIQGMVANTVTLTLKQHTVLST